MGAPEVESWLVSSAGGPYNLDRDGEDDVDFQQPKLTLEDARSNWPAFVDRVQKSLLSSRTKERTAFLKELLLPLVKTPGERQEYSTDIVSLIFF